MPDFKLQDPLVAEEISVQDVNKKNTTLCITNNYLEINFDENSWDAVTKRMITSYRQEEKD